MQDGINTTRKYETACNRYFAAREIYIAAPTRARKAEFEAAKVQFLEESRKIYGRKVK